MTIGLPHLLLVSGLLFSFGLFCVLTRRNAIAILMGIELILNAAILNIAAFSRFAWRPDEAHAVGGQVFAVFGIVLAAAESVVALAIVLQLFRALRSVDAEKATRMKG